MLTHWWVAPSYAGEDFAALVDELLPKPAQNNSFTSRLKRLLKI